MHSVRAVTYLALSAVSLMAGHANLVEKAMQALDDGRHLL